MKYAIIDGTLSLASPKARATCKFCNREMIAKCGERIIWHWAHVPRYKCDPWWENETEWHRKWKDYFPEHFQEVVHFDEAGEKHIADIKTDDGLVIELQHSSISFNEMRSREDFYKTMIWIVDGASFKNNFHILSELPPPESALGKRLRIIRTPRYPLSPNAHGFRITNTPIFLLDEHEITKGDNFVGYDVTMVSSNPSENYDRPKDTALAIQKLYDGDHFIEWRRPRKVWLSAKKPVYVDFGDDRLWLLRKYQDVHWSAKALTKTHFLKNILNSK